MPSSAPEGGWVFRDGTKVAYGVPSLGYTPIPRVGGYASFYSGNGRVYGAYEIDQLPNPNEVLNPDWPIPYALAPWTNVGAFLDDQNRSGTFTSQTPTR